MHHENESASQILVAVDLTRRRGAEKGRPGKSQILCTYYRFEHFSESFLPSRGRSPFERETADAFRKTGAILWETARRPRKSYDKRLPELVRGGINKHAFWHLGISIRLS